MNRTDDGHKPNNFDVDRQIRLEIERIARDVIEWEVPVNADEAPKVRWKPRFDNQHFVLENDNRLIPNDLQVYHDLQLSRGASRPLNPGLEWQFDDPYEEALRRAVINAERLEHFVGCYPITPATRILEIGTRNGQLLRFLRDRGYQHVSGIDCVKLNVLWCQRNGLIVAEMDVHELSRHFAPSSCDVVFAYHVLEHCYDPALALTECYAVLAPGGGLHIEIPLSNVNLNTAHCYQFLPDELGAMLTAQGYAILDYVRLGEIERVVANRPTSTARLPVERSCAGTRKARDG
jgi:SAM-dependent methyltransferase